MNLIKTKDGSYINADMVEVFHILPIKGYSIQACMPCYANDEYPAYIIESYSTKEEAQHALDTIISNLEGV